MSRSQPRQRYSASRARQPSGSSQFGVHHLPNISRSLSTSGFPRFGGINPWRLRTRTSSVAIAAKIFPIRRTTKLDTQSGDLPTIPNAAAHVVKSARLKAEAAEEEAEAEAGADSAGEEPENRMRPSVHPAVRRPPCPSSPRKVGPCIAEIATALNGIEAANQVSCCTVRSPPGRRQPRCFFLR